MYNIYDIYMHVYINIYFAVIRENITQTNSSHRSKGLKLDENKCSQK